jgi:hypothetical protein
MSKKATFVGGQLFWDMFLAYRVAWIMGRYGAGKTSLAVLMLGRLLAEGRVKYAISNIPIDFSTTLTPGTPLFSDLQNAGLLLDEAWIYVDNRQSVLDYAAFIRKFNHFLLLPSVFPIHPRLSYFFVQRVFNAYTLGFPFWVYKWSINNKGIKENGTFAIQYPTAVFGHYPSDFVPADDGNISDAVTSTAKSHGFAGDKKKQKKLPAKEQMAAEFGFEENAEIFEDVAYQIEDSKDDLQKIARAFQRRR